MYIDDALEELEDGISASLYCQAMTAGSESCHCYHMTSFGDSR